jgi:Fe2+ or Zn2+ uptake regulation protein
MQRLAVAEYVLGTEDHPTADRVVAEVKRRHPTLSRATVYNTLGLFVRSGLLRQLTLAEGRVVYDPNTERHHHLVEEPSGRIRDIPWEALEVRGVETVPGIDVADYQVVLRGRVRPE